MADVGGTMCLQSHRASPYKKYCGSVFFYQLSTNNSNTKLWWKLNTKSYKKHLGQVQTQNSFSLRRGFLASSYFALYYSWMAGVQRLRDTKIQNDTHRSNTLQRVTLSSPYPCATLALKEQRKQKVDTLSFLLMYRKWLQQYMNRELPDVQAGSRKGRGTRDQIANIRWIIKKAREFQKNIYFCFIDYAKAFDCVDHNKLENS